MTLARIDSATNDRYGGTAYTSARTRRTETRASNGVSTLFRYTGEQLDAETGFTYLRARYLNPGLGRFTSADTVQPNAPGTQGYNVYAYVAGNPTTWVDPSGHVAFAPGFSAAAPAGAPAIVQIGARYLAFQAATGNFVQRLMGVCAAGRSGYCITAVATAVAFPILACAFYPGCAQWALAQAGIISEYGSAVSSATTWDTTSVKDAPKTWPRAQVRPAPGPIALSCAVTPPVILDPVTFFFHIWVGHGPWALSHQGKFAGTMAEAYGQIFGAANVATGWGFDRGACRTHFYFPGIGEWKAGRESNCLRIVTKGAVGPPWFIGTAYPVKDSNCGF